MEDVFLIVDLNNDPETGTKRKALVDEIQIKDSFVRMFIRVYNYNVNNEIIIRKSVIVQPMLFDSFDAYIDVGVNPPIEVKPTKYEPLEFDQSVISPIPKIDFMKIIPADSSNGKTIWSNIQDIVRANVLYLEATNRLL